MNHQWTPAGQQHYQTATPSHPAAALPPNQTNPAGRIIRVTNVHKQASNGDLATFFNECDVLDVRRSYLSRTDKSQASPICWVLLSTPEEARMAKFRLHNVPLHGRPIRIELADALRPGFNIPRVLRNRFVIYSSDGGMFVPWDQPSRNVRHRRNASTSSIAYARRMSGAQNQSGNPSPAARPIQEPTQQFTQQAFQQVSRQVSEQVTQQVTQQLYQQVSQRIPPQVTQQAAQQVTPEPPSGTRTTRWSWSGQPPIISEEDWFNFDNWLIRQGHRRSRVYDATNEE